MTSKPEGLDQSYYSDRPPVLSIDFAQPPTLEAHPLIICAACVQHTLESIDNGRIMPPEICAMNRWETAWCGYTFNTRAEGIVRPDDHLIAKVHGATGTGSPNALVARNDSLPSPSLRRRDFILNLFRMWL